MEYAKAVTSLVVTERGMVYTVLGLSLFILTISILSDYTGKAEAKTAAAEHQLEVLKDTIMEIEQQRIEDEEQTQLEERWNTTHDSID